jgi:hypothetical protein
MSVFNGLVHVNFLISEIFILRIKLSYLNHKRPNAIADFFGGE